MLTTTALASDVTVSLKEKLVDFEEYNFPCFSPIFMKHASIGTNLFCGPFKNCLSKAHFTKLGFSLRDVQMLMAELQMLNVLFFEKKKKKVVLFCFFNNNGQSRYSRKS